MVPDKYIHEGDSIFGSNVRIGRARSRLASKGNGIMRKGVFYTASGEDRRRLDAIANDPSAQHKHVWRARIILEGANGCGTMEIISRTGKAKNTVYRWQRRCMEEGVDGLLYEATRPPGTPPVADWKVREVVELTLSPPDGEATHWTLRAMAKRVGLGFSTVRRIWQRYGLRPHRFRKFKVSNDPAYVDKVRAIHGLYVNPLVPSGGVIGG